MTAAGDSPAPAAPPADAQAVLAEARAHHMAGRLFEAERLYKRLAADRPRDATLLSRLGAALAGQGKMVEALATLERALEIDAALVDALNNIAIVYRLLGRAEDAIGAFRRALSLAPDDLSARVNLADLLRDGGDFDAAAACYREALAVDGGFAEAHNGLGAVLVEQGDFAAAQASFERALELNPGHAEALNNLGLLKRRQGDYDAALAHCRKAVAVRPRMVEAHVNLGNTLRAVGDYDGSAAALRAALDIDRNHPDAHWNLGLALLAQGKFDEGWGEYEWRAKCRAFRAQRWDFGCPRWDGARMRRKNVLLYAEQGFGDAIQFVRYAPLVAERVSHVIVRCPAALTRLFESIPGVDAAGPDIETETNFHYAAPLMSLPAIFGTDAASIPANVPYLRPPKGATAVHSASAPAGALQVGLVWAGNPGHQNDRNRSIDLKLLAPLLDVEGCAFASLQVGAAGDAIAAAGFADRIADLGQRLGDFADTAATITTLDLVIGVDTAVVHLAGALAKPVWTLLPLVPDWRWLTGRDDSPWYPTMRLFRQPAAGDWPGTIAAVARALAAMVRERA